MDINEYVKSILEIQEKEGADFFPCPRCGHEKMKHECVDNALSRYRNVYICSDCGMDEALNGDLDLNKWGFTSIIKKE